MIHHGASGPLLSSAMANTQQPHGQTASNQPQPAVHGQGGPAGQAGQNNSAKHSHRHNITDYSPDWAWSDVSRLCRDIRKTNTDFSNLNLGNTQKQGDITYKVLSKGKKEIITKMKVK